MNHDILSLSGNLFTFTNQKCECLVDTTHEDNGQEVKTLRIRAVKDEQIKFAYMPQEGLVRINPSTGSVLSKNVLAELLAMRDNDIQAMVSFILDNGFFIPISQVVFETFPYETINLLFRRVKFTVELMTMLQTPRKQYYAMLSRICWLIFMQPVVLKPSDENETYQSCIHSFQIHAHSMESCSDDEQQFLEGDIYEDPNDGVYHIPDSVRPPRTDIEYLKYRSIIEEPEWDGYPGVPAKPSLFDIQLLTAMFKNLTDVPPAERKVIEFFYHFRWEIGTLESVTQDAQLIFRYDIKENYQKYFDDEMKKALLDVAKLTVKEEIDHALFGISAAYDMESMAPSWYIPDLLAGLFFSVFYMRSDMEIYRECANTTCHQYFLVSTTNSRKKYCCPECGNAMAQRMLRKRKKEKKEQTP